jgi:hypothetical protein
MNTLCRRCKLLVFDCRNYKNYLTVFLYATPYSFVDRYQLYSYRGKINRYHQDLYFKGAEGTCFSERNLQRIHTRPHNQSMTDNAVAALRPLEVFLVFCVWFCCVLLDSYAYRLGHFT